MYMYVKYMYLQLFIHCFKMNIFFFSFLHFSSKIEREKKQQARDAGLIRQTVSGPEVSQIYPIPGYDWSFDW